MSATTPYWELFIRYAPKAFALFNAAIFLDSLRYKFTDHPKTQEIFGRLDSWAGGLGLRGLFGHTGLFSQYVIGMAELVASVLLIGAVFVGPMRDLLPLGGLIGLAVMTGAISFHLFTPLGLDPNHDGGGLFRSACVVWLFSFLLVIMEFKSLVSLATRLVQAFAWA